jgi:cardiolipin synthase (CMP-forming)
MNWSWLPNAITLIRMLLSVPLAWLILESDHLWALTVALVAGFSDALDGLLAKRFDWRSQLGGWLDPVADKVMLTAAFVAFGVIEVLPWWLVLLILARDLAIVLGALVYHNLIGPLQAQPTPLSKLTTFLQIVLVLAVLLHDLPALDLPAWLLIALIVATGIATVASGLHYVVTWTIKARRDWRTRRS